MDKIYEAYIQTINESGTITLDLHGDEDTFMDTFDGAMKLSKQGNKIHISDLTHDTVLSLTKELLGKKSLYDVKVMQFEFKKESDAKDFADSSKHARANRKKVNIRFGSIIPGELLQLIFAAELYKASMHIK